jgi:pyruvate formate lyase activating enzyme
MSSGPSRPGAKTPGECHELIPSASRRLGGELFLERREFLKSAAVLPCFCGSLLGAPAANDARFTVEAKFYEKLPSKKVNCHLCSRECVIDDAGRGYCGVRENRGGKYYSLVHSRICSMAVDPIEKKPLFHFAPGARAFSVATAGCNFNCKMCQNWEISQSRPEQLRSEYIPPQRLAELARQNRCLSIAFTYNEPTVFTEYVLDAAAAAREAGVRSVMISNGYARPEPIAEICKRVDAIKIDLKAFSEKFYREIANGEMKPVLNTIAAIKKHGTWLEIVYLVIPTLNDSDQEFRGMAQWVKAAVGPDVPVHFSQFHPEYLLRNLPVTPVATLERAKAICDAEGLRYVYLGNVPGHPAENTRCPKCGRVIVERAGFTVKAFNLTKGKCKFCQNPIPGMWEGATA